MSLFSFESLALEATGLVGSTAPMPLVVSWASTLIQELSRIKKLQTYRVMKELYIPSTITTGLVSATRDSNRVTGNGIAATAWLSGQELANESYYIRIRTIWYPIGSREGNTLTFKPPAFYAEDTITDHTYVLLKKYHKLSPDVDQLEEHMTHARFGSPLPIITKDQMDYLYPARWTSYASSGGVPQHVCEVELSVDQQRQVEVYPYSQLSEVLYYNAWLKPPEYKYTDYIPNFINYASLIEGVKHRLYEYEANRAKEVQMKQVLLNEKARQKTIWDRAKEELFLHEPALSQGGMSVQLLRDRFISTHRDINNAYSQVWSREP